LAISWFSPLRQIISARAARCARALRFAIITIIIFVIFAFSLMAIAIDYFHAIRHAGAFAIISSFAIT
jgi:hypothetical protein